MNSKAWPAGAGLTPWQHILEASGWGRPHRNLSLTRTPDGRAQSWAGRFLSHCPGQRALRPTAGTSAAVSHRPGPGAPCPAWVPRCPGSQGPNSTSRPLSTPPHVCLLTCETPLHWVTELILLSLSSVQGAGQTDGRPPGSLQRAAWPRVVHRSLWWVSPWHTPWPENRTWAPESGGEVGTQHGASSQASRPKGGQGSRSCWTFH